MIRPAIDSINQAIQNQNAAQFDRNFVLLTTTCNSCHQAAGFRFNVVKIPDAPAFPNQDFRVQKLQ